MIWFKSVQQITIYDRDLKRDRRLELPKRCDAKKGNQDKNANKSVNNSSFHFGEEIFKTIKPKDCCKNRRVHVSTGEIYSH